MAQNAKDMGLVPTLGTIYPIFIGTQDTASMTSMIGEFILFMYVCKMTAYMHVIVSSKIPIITKGGGVLSNNEAVRVRSQ